MAYVPLKYVLAVSEQTRKQLKISFLFTLGICLLHFVPSMKILFCEGGADMLTTIKKRFLLLIVLEQRGKVSDVIQPLRLETLKNSTLLLFESQKNRLWRQFWTCPWLVPVSKSLMGRRYLVNNKQDKRLLQNWSEVKT